MQQPPCEANHYYQAHVSLLLDSYERLLNRPLLDAPNDVELGRQVFFADFALLSHNTDADPLFNYANQTALDLFELSWDEFFGMPSRLSVQAVNQQARERLMAKVTADGFVDDYAGVRISKTGKCFQIQKAIIWNVYDLQGVYHGQAAWFKDWAWLS